jgi:hypothetical protein
MDAAQRTHHPAEGQNSLAPLFRHATRYEDVVVSRWLTDGSEVLDEGGWLEHLGVSTAHSGADVGLTGPVGCPRCGPRGATRLVVAVPDPTVEGAPTVDLAPYRPGTARPGS